MLKGDAYASALPGATATAFGNWESLPPPDGNGRWADSFLAREQAPQRGRGRGRGSGTQHAGRGGGRTGGTAASSRGIGGKRSAGAAAVRATRARGRGSHRGMRQRGESSLPSSDAEAQSPEPGGRAEQPVQPLPFVMPLERREAAAQRLLSITSAGYAPSSVAYLQLHKALAVRGRLKTHEWVTLAGR